MRYTFKHKAVVLAVMTSLVGCSTIEPQVNALKKKSIDDINYHRERVEAQKPVVTYTNTPWIMGAAVQLAEPQLPILKQKIAYHPTRPVSLADVASWITQNTGLVVDIAELQTGSNIQGNSMGMSGMNGMNGMGNMGMNGMSMPNMAVGNMGINGQPGMNGFSTYVQPQTMWSMTVNYEGGLSGLLDVVANKSSAWWRVVDGKINFYRYESKTFYFPALARKFTSDNTINSTQNSAGGSGTVNSGSSSPSGGANSVSNYAVDTWSDLEATAKIVAAGAQVAANKASGSVTVTGTPAQVRAVEKWAKELADQQSQQVAITVHIYNVRITNDDNYNWNPSIVFKNAAGTYGFNWTGPQAPAIVSGTNPSKLGVDVLTNTTGNSSQFAGSKLAIQAISQMGEITESITQTLITLNGQPMPVQLANTQGYLASSTTTVTANVGTTATLNPGSLTTGFTALFIPRIVNGKIILGMDIQNSSDKGFTELSSGDSKIQAPNYDSNSSTQSVSLTPGDALLLTGLQRDNGAIRKNGVGKANNYLLGGGFGNSHGKQMIAIVVSAQVI